MSIVKSAAALLAITLSVNVFACDIHGNSGIAPENDLYIPINKGRSGLGLTKNQFMETIDSIMEVYRPIIEGMGKKLIVNKRWDDGTVNASASQSGDTWTVNMYGGLARHHETNQEGFATVVCHELGHHLGGSPKYTRFFMSTWASNEGQSDYWATLKCLRKIWKHDDNMEIVKSRTIDPEVAKLCQGVYATPEDQALCQRISIGAKSLSRLLASLRKVKVMPEFNTPSKKVQRWRTLQRHPEAQCRMDTYIHGALCDKDPYQDVSHSDPNVGTCSRKDDYTVGTRPLCWYKPKRGWFSVEEVTDIGFTVN